MQLRVFGEWVTVAAPSDRELQELQLRPVLLGPRREAEVMAWIEQVRMALNYEDRRFLRSMRIGAWETPL